MKTKLLFLITMLFLFQLNAQTYILNNDFESDAVGTLPEGWVIRYNGSGAADQKVVDAPVKNGSHSLQVSGTSWAANLHKNVSEMPNYVTLEGWMYAKNVVSGGRCGLAIGNPTTGTWGAFLARVEFYNGNLITFYHTGNSGGYGTQYILQSAEADRWYHAKLEVNRLTATYKVYINGVLASSNTGGSVTTEFPLLTIAAPTSVELYGNSMVYFDDVKLYETKKPVAFYPFNGNANDESGNDYHGTVYDATLTTDRNGNANSAYEFNGIDNYIDIGDWENGGPMSFTFWARWDAYNWYSRIIDLGNGSSSNNIIVGNYRSDNGLFFSCYNGASETKMWTPTISIGKWDFYAATVDENGIMTLYKNGQQIAEKADGFTPNTMLRTEQFIGKSNFSQDAYFEGAIDEVKIYDYVLTLEEIQSDYNNNLIAYYPFNGDANDESGYDNHGTVNGANLTTDRFGNADSAYYFDGNDIITVNHNDILNSEEELSISVWIKPDLQQNAMILGKSNYVTATNYLLRTKSTGFLQFEYKNYANSNNLPLTVNEWNHIAVVSLSDDSQQIYVNGSLASHTVDTSPYGIVTNVLTIGARQGAEYFRGSIDDLMIFKSSLSESEVLSLFNNNSLNIQTHNVEKNRIINFQNNVLTFTSSDNYTRLKSLFIYNLTGQIVFESSNLTNTLDLNFLKQGIYIVKAETDNHIREVKKIFVR